MIALAFFHRSALTVDCDQCRRPFPLTQGGVCEVCKRILCGTHLHGSWVRRLMVDLGARPVCVECRAKGRA